jgi:hypothetical protein
MFLALASVVCSDASAQNISVTEGDVQTNVAPVTYDSLSVSGTSALGAASTYTAAADLTLTNGLSVSSSGVFNANANVTAGGVSSSSDGVINLNSGTLTAGNLSLSGPSSVTRTGGNYSVNDLYLSGGALLTYGDGDSITNLLSIDGGSFSKTRTLNAGYFRVTNATLDLIAGDSFNNPAANPWQNGPNTIANGGVLNVNGDVAVAGWVSAHSGGVVNLNGDMTVGGQVSSSAGGVINLNNSDLTAGALSLAEPTSLTRTGGNYSVNDLYLSGGASLNYGDGDSITNLLSLDGGSFSKTRTLNAGYFRVTNATLDLIAGDSFNNPTANPWQNGPNTIANGGVLNVNGDVTVAGWVSSHSGGVVNLNGGTLTVGNLSLSGPSSVTRTGGYYSVSNLYLSGGASLNYGDGDSITNVLSLDGSSFSKTRTLSVSDLYLSNGASLAYGDGDSITNLLSIDGGSFSKTRTLNAGYFRVTNATLDLIAGDSFNNPAANPWQNGPNTIANGGVLNVNGDVAVAGWVSAHSGGVVNLNGDMTVGGQVSSSAGGVINLNNSDLTAGALSLAEPTSLTRTGGNYSVNDLYLSGGASLNYGDGDSITNLLSLDGGSFSKTRTLNAGYFRVTNATLDLIAGDSFNNPTANPWQNGPNTIANGGVLNVNGDVTVAGWVSSHSGGVVNLNGGTLTVGNLALSGPNSLTRTGGHYAVGDLYLSNGATLTYGDGDSISNALSIDGISSSFAGYEPLSLNSLSITNGGVLSLHAFTGSGAFSNWGLRLLGDSQSFLETLITGSRITGTWGPMSVFYDPTSNYTFVTATAAVPEIDPAGIGSVMALVTGALALLERRKRSA